MRSSTKPPLGCSGTARGEGFGPSWGRSVSVKLPPMCAGFRVWGLGFRVWGLGFGVWGLGSGVWGLGSGSAVWGLGFGLCRVTMLPQH